MNELECNVRNRCRTLRAVHDELIGPEQIGQPLEGEVPVRMTSEAFRAFLPRRQSDKQEILGESPARRYAAGVLHPWCSEPDAADSQWEEETFLSETVEDEESGNDQQQSTLRSRVRRRAFSEEPGEDTEEDTDILSANAARPCALGLSVVLIPERSRQPLEVSLMSVYRSGGHDDDIIESASGFYVARKVTVETEDESEADDASRTLWCRRPLLDDGEQVPALQLYAKDLEKDGTRAFPSVNGFPSRLELRWHRRSWPEAPEGHRIFTFTVINRGGGQGAEIVQTLFQSGLRLAVPDEALGTYPGALLGAGQDRPPEDDARIAELLYHRRLTLAVGHGCASDWSEVHEDGSRRVWATFLPTWEIPPVSFKALDSDGNELVLPMRRLAGLDDEGTNETASQDSMKALLDAYGNWIERLDIETLSDQRKETGAVLVERCQLAFERMRRGLDILEEDETALDAFRLANQAMLMSQHRTPLPDARMPNDESIPYEKLDLLGERERQFEQKKEIGRWRPFQLAFLLMTIPDIVEDDAGENPERLAVDLIWFPTGGGKTEAYLGLAAFTVFYNRLSGRELSETGERHSSTIIMRYTLRLLTAQQFQRAVTLFCAMELIRRQDTVRDRLEGPRFSVGLWVGGTVSPNTSKEASRKLKIMRDPSSAKPDDDPNSNPFVLLQCPWCSARFGRHKSKKQGKQTIWDVSGYAPQGSGVTEKVIFRCPEKDCEFGPGHQNIPAVPAMVVDDQIYDSPPSLLISTVDKFAQLAWKPESRGLLGLGKNGERTGRSPELIIQDELHLITGPLGTMVGHFESAVDFLCRHDGGVPSKVIASTATAAFAGDQVRGLFARDDLRVFPPSGLDAADSFFAREMADRPGRLYAGVMAPEHRSLQTTQRHVYAALLQVGADIAMGANEHRARLEADPWWTLLCYYNSIRELGGALTLFGADVQDQLKVLQRRRDLSPQRLRQLKADDSVMELTSRIRSDEVPSALQDLSRPIHRFATDKDKMPTCWVDFRDSQNNWAPVQDACLASNMIEVGVDVGRLAMMVIVGQPKTTSSYIQASSRIGRRQDRPGLVVTLYSNTKPRDRSHFERFRAYHQAIYQWVEPTSVTPFSMPVVERALKAVLVAMARQTNPSNRTPNEVSAALSADEDLSWDDIRTTLKERCRSVTGNDEVIFNNFQQQLSRLIHFWSLREPPRWGNANGHTGDGNRPLMHPSGHAAPPHWDTVWRVPLSLRAVDSSCEAAITDSYSDSGDQ